MNDRLESVLTDLATESSRLDGLVAPLDVDGWRLATPASGWDIAHQIAHLTWTDEAVIAAATEPEAWDRLLEGAMANPDGFVDGAATAVASDGDLLGRWRASRSRLAAVLRAVPDGDRLPWYGPPMSAVSMATARFMETWAHGRDVADALGVRFPADDRVRHVVHLGVRTRDFAFALHRRTPPAQEFRVCLALPGGDCWESGPEGAEQSVTGSAHDFALLVTQRANRDDLDLVASGPDADTWLDIAQAFAGPPGPGRSAR